MKIFLASDHAGFELKARIYTALRSQGHEVTDCGAHSYDAEDDYPDFVKPCAEAVVAENARGVAARGIVLGKSGEGEAMCANRVKGIRAAVFYGGSLELVTLAREHNDANILSLGAAFLSPEEALAAIALFLDTPFSAETRHARRLGKF